MTINQLNARQFGAISRAFTEIAKVVATQEEKLTDAMPAWCDTIATVGPGGIRVSFVEGFSDFDENYDRNVSWSSLRKDARELSPDVARLTIVQVEKLLGTLKKRASSTH